MCVCVCVCGVCLRVRCGVVWFVCGVFVWCGVCVCVCVCVVWCGVCLCVWCGVCVSISTWNRLIVFTKQYQQYVAGRNPSPLFLISQNPLKKKTWRARAHNCKARATLDSRTAET